MQHDLIIDNDIYANVRADINNALQALGSQQSGASEPLITYAHMIWCDTTANLVKQRNAANNAWITIGILGAANWGNASLASPNFTGNPTAPTAALNDNDTSIATTAFVTNQMNTRRYLVQEVFGFYETETTLSTNNTWTDTGLQVTITPQFSNSVIYLFVNLAAVSLDATSTVQSRITSSVSPTTFGIHGGIQCDQDMMSNIYMMDIHFPAVTSAVTYKAQFHKSTAGSAKAQSGGRKSTFLALEYRRY